MHPAYLVCLSQCPCLTAEHGIDIISSDRLRQLLWEVDLEYLADQEGGLTRRVGSAATQYGVSLCVWVVDHPQVRAGTHACSEIG